MKYIDEFRDGVLAQNIAANIALEADPSRVYNLMEFCGGHTHAISRYGLADLLPSAVRMIHGPGCPVCVLPIGRIDMAICLALEKPVTLCTYGDCLRVPASNGMTMLKAKAQGADIRMVYSVMDALALARKQQGREIVFFAIGFETTTPPTAVAIRQARAEGLRNFSVICNHVLTPAAMHAILAQSDRVQIHGFVGPAHVSTVIGSHPYEFFAAIYGKPVVIAGFEPLDVLQAILMLVRQINQSRAEVENEFIRAVSPEGNRKAQALMAETLEIRETYEWRGLGTIPQSAMKLRPEYADLDTEMRFGLDYRPVPDHKACECGAILRGEKRPQDCKIFGTACTPESPSALAWCHRKALAPLITFTAACRTASSKSVLLQRHKAMKINWKQDVVELNHGSGGRAMAQLIEELFAANFDNEYLAQGNDGAVMPALDGPLIMSTDSHVVSPLFFPGGNIGSLAVYGTVNDVAVMGAKPLYLAASFILEEGFPLTDLKRIVESMAQAARKCGVSIVTGDTKVVEQGKGDGVFITTTGVGVKRNGLQLSGNLAQPGDKILLSGALGEHGLAILAQRENLALDAAVVSDSAPLHDLIAEMLDCGAKIRVMRDPTRGGLATTLNEIAKQSKIGMLVDEAAIPKNETVEAACEFLGFDPLYIANEGKLVVICAPESAENLCRVMRGHPLAVNTAIIGEVLADDHCFVQMKTRMGGHRIVDWLAGEQLPRIC